MKKLTILFLCILPLLVHAQDYFIKDIEPSECNFCNKRFHFKDLITLEHTSIKNQASSGTCWSYSTNSFLESEMMRMGKNPVELSQMYSARCVYLDKAENYVRMHGAIAWGDGGECHDVLNMYSKYGAMPYDAYPGLNYGTRKNKTGELAAVLKGMLDAVVSNPNGKLTSAWKNAVSATLDAYLGELTETFKFDGRRYTPISFARERVGIHPEDYIEFSSFSNQPYYKKTILMVPDNWSYNRVYNVQMDDLTDIIDRAINHGFTVAWAADISEKYFSWKNGIAYVPEKEVDDMSEDEKKMMFFGPIFKERFITPGMRQTAFDNYETTDDHGMHIVGIAEDQYHKKYYKVKNSWDSKNDHNGYMYVTKTYVKYKTTAILLHKSAVSGDLRNRLNLGTSREY